MDLTDNVIEEVQKKEGLIASFLDTLPEKALNLGIRIGLALVFFFIGMQLIRLIRKIIRKSMNRAGAEMGVIQFVDSFVKASLYIILILTLAVSLKATITSLGASIYVHDLMEGAAATLYSMLPAVIFVVACILAFASGTSWGTFGILIPIVTAIFPASSKLLILSLIHI